MKRSPLWLLNQVCDIATKFEYAQGAVVLGGVTLLITAGVIMRYIFDSPIPWVLQVSAWLVIFLGVLVAAFGQRGGYQVSIDIITSRMRPMRQATIAIVTNILALIVIIILSQVAYGTMAFSLAVDETAMGAIRPHMAPLKFMMLLGFCLVGLVFFTNIFQSVNYLKELKNKNTLL